MSNYINLCINGEVLIEDIDDYIDEWHEGNGIEKLYVFLGMTEEEYKYYLVDEDVLPHIINAHKFHSNFEFKLVAANSTNVKLPFAARSSDLDKAECLIEYLETNY